MQRGITQPRDILSGSRGKDRLETSHPFQTDTSIRIRAVVARALPVVVYSAVISSRHATGHRSAGFLPTENCCLNTTRMRFSHKRDAKPFHGQITRPPPFLFASSSHIFGERRKQLWPVSFQGGTTWRLENLRDCSTESEVPTCSMLCSWCWEPVGCQWLSWAPHRVLRGCSAGPRTTTFLSQLRWLLPHSVSPSTIFLRALHSARGPHPYHLSRPLASSLPQSPCFPKQVYHFLHENIWG